MSSQVDRRISEAASLRVAPLSVVISSVNNEAFDEWRESGSSVSVAPRPHSPRPRRSHLPWIVYLAFW